MRDWNNGCYLRKLIYQENSRLSLTNNLPENWYLTKLFNSVLRTGYNSRQQKIAEIHKNGKTSAWKSTRAQEGEHFGMYWIVSWQENSIIFVTRKQPGVSCYEMHCVKSGNSKTNRLVKTGIIWKIIQSHKLLMWGWIVLSQRLERGILENVNLIPLD